MALPTQYKSIVVHAYSGMDTTKPDWTKSQQRGLIRSSERMLAQKVDQGDTPRHALERVFAFYTPESDTEGARADWFMRLAQEKAAELDIDLGSLEQLQRMRASGYDMPFDNQGQPRTVPHQPKTDSGPSKAGGWFKAHTPQFSGRINEGFGLK